MAKETNSTIIARIDERQKQVFGAVGIALITLGKAILDLVIVTKAAQ